MPDQLRLQGRICDWEPQRGCGLVAEAGSGHRTYLPASAFGRVQRRPNIGDRITFEIELDEHQRPRAARAAFASRRIGRPMRGELWTGHSQRRGLLLLILLLAALALFWWETRALA